MQKTQQRFPIPVLKAHLSSAAPPHDTNPAPSPFLQGKKPYPLELHINPHPSLLRWSLLLMLHAVRPCYVLSIPSYQAPINSSSLSSPATLPRPISHISQTI